MKAIKNNRFLSFCIVATALLCSCSKEPVESFAEGDPTSPILPDAGVAATVETKADLSGAVSGKAFPANTAKVFSVVGYKGTAAPTTNWSSPYIANIAVNSGASSTLSFATPQYYPVDGSKVYFYAYSPVSGATYTAGTSSAAPKVAWTITGGQDIMAAQVTTGIARAATGTQTQPVFAFTHKLKQVKFKVVKDASFEDNIKLTSLMIIGAKTTATLNLSTGAVSWGSTTGNLTVYSNATGQALTTTAASVGSAMMFEPGTSFKVRAVAGGQQYADATVTLTGTGAGTAGYSHEVTLKFMRNVITPTATISDWTTTGTGSAADIPVEPDMYIKDITLNSSSSVTIPRAGGTFTLVAQTLTSPTSNISWLVKDADDNEVGRSTSYSAYNSATVTVDSYVNAHWNATRSLTLYWSYNGSEYRQYDGTYTLKQSGTIESATFSVGATSYSNEVTFEYGGDRTLAVVGEWLSGDKIVLRSGTKVQGPYALSSEMIITLPANTSTANTLNWEICGVESDGTYTETGLSLQQEKSTDTNPSGWLYMNGILMKSEGRTYQPDCITAATNAASSGAMLPETKYLNTAIYNALMSYGKWNLDDSADMWRSKTRTSGTSRNGAVHYNPNTGMWGDYYSNGGMKACILVRVL